MNGKVVTELGTKAGPNDRILVNGRPLPARPSAVCVVLNKPAGVVTTRSDPQQRATVLGLLPPVFTHLFPVGRLDLQSTGLVLLTNDGDLAARLTHPRYHVPRTYRVKVTGVPDERALDRLRRGVRLADGRASAAEVVIERRLPTKTWLRITVHEGRTHLVRRLCDAIGHSAEKLQRVAFGPLGLGRLALGACRVLTPEEVRALRHATRTARSGVVGRSVRQRREAGAPSIS